MNRIRKNYLILSLFLIGAHSLVHTDELNGQVIRSVSPTTASKGTVLRITGTGFGTVRDNVNVFIRTDLTNVPLTVQSVSNSEIRAVLGVIPDIAKSGRVVVQLGTGARAPIQFESDAFTDQDTSWVWSRNTRSSEAQSPQTVILNFSSPLPGITWTFGSIVNNRLLLPIHEAWGRGSKVELHAQVHNNEIRLGAGLSLFGFEMERNTTVSQQANLLCDIIQDTLQQQEITYVDCDVTEFQGTHAIQLTFDVRGAPRDPTVDQGNISLCVTESSEPAIRVDSITPSSARAGERVTIRGHGFDPDPNNNAVAIYAGDGNKLGAAFEIVEASPTLMVGLVNPLRERFAKPMPIAIPPWDDWIGPGNLIVSTGEGQIHENGSRTRFWRRSTTSVETRSDQQFQILQSLGTVPGRNCFSNAEVSNGAIMIKAPTFLYPVGTEIELWLSFSTPGDLISESYHVSDLVLESDARLSSIACDLIHKTLSNNDSPLRCETTNMPDQEVTLISLSMPPGVPEVDKGTLTICVTTPTVDQPQVEDFSPSEGATGDRIQIAGSNFGDQPQAISVLSVSGGSALSFKVVDVQDSSLGANLGPVNPKWVLGKPIPAWRPTDGGKPVPIWDLTKPGPIRVLKGVGGVSKPINDPLLKPIGILGQAKAWERRGILPSTSAEPFIATKPIAPLDLAKPIKPVGPAHGAGIEQKGLQPSERPEIACSYGLVRDGKMVLYLRGFWPSTHDFRLYFSAHNDAANMGAEVYVDRFNLETENIRQAAQSFSAYLSHLLMELIPDSQVLLETEISNIDDGAIKIEVFFADGTEIEYGVFNLCLLEPSSSTGSIIPGDCNGDGQLDVSDTICLLTFLFLGVPEELPCGPPGEPEPDPSDVVLLDWNGDGGTPDISDAIAMLGNLFLGHAPHVLGTSCIPIRGCPDACGR